MSHDLGAARVGPPLDVTAAIPRAELAAAGGGALAEGGPETARVRIKYTTGFHVKGRGADVTISFKELVKGLKRLDEPGDELAVDEPEKNEAAIQSKFSSIHSLPVSLRVESAVAVDKVGTDVTCRYAFKLFDHGKKKEINGPFRFKHSNDTRKATVADAYTGVNGDTTKVGYPLMLAKDPDTREALETPYAIPDDNKVYWRVQMDHLHEGVTHYTDPVTGAVMVLMPVNSRAAVLAEHALSIRNKVIVPPLRANANHRFGGNATNGVLQLGMPMYGEVVNAYRKKLDEVAAKSFDLSTVVASVSELPLFAAGDAAERDDFVLVSWTLEVQMPIQDGAKKSGALGAPRGMGAAAAADDDDEEDDDDDEEEDEPAPTGAFAAKASSSKKF